MSIYVLLYDSCTLFEIVLACHFIKTKYEIVPVNISNRIVNTVEGLPVQCAVDLDHVDVKERDLIIFPGGNIEPLLHNSKLKQFLLNAKQMNCRFGAICAGVKLMKQFKIVDCGEYEEGQDLIITDRYVCSKPNAYVDFALELGKMLDIYKDEADYNETVDFFKNFNDCT